MTTVNPRKMTNLPDKVITPNYTPFPNYQQRVHSVPCKMCGRLITLYDDRHSEDFCLTCGLVSQTAFDKNNNIPYGSYSYEKPYTGTGYTYTERQFFKSRHKKPPTKLSSSEQNNIHYHHIIDVIKHDLCLTQVDIQDVFNIVKKCGGLTNIHVGCPSEQVLIGICRYVLIRRGVTGYLTTFSNQIYREYGLTRKKYEKIKNNIEKIMRLKLCNT